MTKFLRLIALLALCTPAFALDPGNFGGAFKPQTKVDGFQVSTTVAGITANAVAGVLPARDAEYRQVSIYNQSATGTAYVNFGAHAGANAVRAATVASDMPIAPNSRVVITLDLWMTDMSVIMVTAAGNVIFTLGSGGS